MIKNTIKSTTKSRYFTFLLYPESLPEDWIMKLEMIDLPMAISPLHDKDKSDVKGQKYKKPHYHVLYIAKNPVTAQSVRNRIKRALGNKSVAMVQIVITSVENVYLYLTHESKDAIAEKKHVYNKNDIIHLNNFDLDRYITLSVEEKEELYDTICDIIEKYQLANIFELRTYIRARGELHGIRSMREVNSALKSNTGLIRLYFDSSYQRRTYGYREIVDPETGEIISDVKPNQGDGPEED